MVEICLSKHRILVKRWTPERVKYVGSVTLSGASMKYVALLSALLMMVAASFAQTVTYAVKQVSAGGQHTCLLTTTGGVKCWGGNMFGQLGDNTTIDRSTPTDVVGLTSGVASISASINSHTCAVTTADGLKCWGCGVRGANGNNLAPSDDTPSDVIGLTAGVAEVAVGGEQACALTTAGGVKCWGWNNKGQISDGSRTDRNTPVDVVGVGTSTPSTNAQPQVLDSINLDGGASRALVVRSPSNQLQAERFNGSQFVFSTLTDPGINYRIVGAVALNGGGKSDLVFQDITQGEFGDVLVWRGFNPATQFKLRQVKRVWDVQAVGDLDGDGFWR